MNAPFWVCYEEDLYSPWVVRAFAKTTSETRRRGYWLRRDALVRVKRLRRMWLVWMLAEAFRQVGKPSCSEEELVRAFHEAIKTRTVKVAVLDIRRAAREVGLAPDDVIRWTPGMLYAGDLLKSLPPGWLETSLAVAQGVGNVGITVGQRWRPLDPRRKKGFTIARIEGDVVHGDDGREVRASRLMKRYRPEA